MIQYFLNYIYIDVSILSSKIIPIFINCEIIIYLFLDLFL